MLYFDDASTSRPDNEVLKVYNEVATKYWYNPSSPHLLGLSSFSLYQQAEALVKKTLNLNDKQVFFTKGATEANNFAIYGICNPYLGQNKHIITTKIEHPSVLACFEDLATKGFEVTYLNVDCDGIININELRANLKNNTILVSVQWVNNIIGSIQPINQIIDICQNYPSLKLHVDGVQGIGKMPIDFDINKIDLFTISAHKLHGLKGAGLLIHHQKLDLPLKSAGDYPGTIDLASVIACAKALQLAMLNQKESLAQVTKLHKYLKNLIIKNDNILINGSKNNYSPFLFNISIKNKNAETTMHYLEQFDIFVSIGSACSSKLNKPETTILNITNDVNRAKSSIRISLNREHKIEDLDKLIYHLNYFAQSSKNKE